MDGSGSAYLNNLATALASHFGRDVSRWAAVTQGGGVRKAYAGGGAPVITSPDTGGHTPSAAAPGLPFNLGGIAARLKGHVPQLLIFKRELSAAEVNSLGSFFAPIYGIAA